MGVNNPNMIPSLSTARQVGRPVQDEWGIFDPEQAGIEAVLRRLTAISNAQDAASTPTTPAEAK